MNNMNRSADCGGKGEKSMVCTPTSVDFGYGLMTRLDELAAFSESSEYLVRRCFTPEHRRANELVGRWMAEAGMAVRTDEIGNIVGRYGGRARGAPALLTGSHLDTVVDAGRYDGMLGVLTPIACIDALNQSGERFDFAIEVIGFADEEGVRFQSTYLGSRAIAGTFDPSLLERVDADGIRMDQAMREFGLDPNRIGDARRNPDEVLAFAELHIEQGPVLESEDLALGIVTAIAGATRLAITVRGEAGHAGTVPMGLRRDALAASAEMVLAIEKRCRRDEGLVGTVGRLEAAPGAINVIPGEVRLTLDLRAPQDAVRQAALADIKVAIEGIAERRAVELLVEQTHDAASAPCAEWMQSQLGGAVESVCGRVLSLPSGAGHDTAAMTALTDVGMIFVRCKGGISHNRAESITAEDADAGARALLHFFERFRKES